MQTVSLEVRGMSCGHCVAAVEKALTSVDGVEVAQVDIGTATVSLDPAVASVEAILAAVEDAGYEAQVA